MARPRAKVFVTNARVALVSPYALSVFGGVQEQVLAMSRGLAARGRDVLILCPDGNDQATYESPATVERVGPLLSVPANGSRAPLTLSPAATTKARRVLERFDPAVVHFHEPFAPLLGWSSLRRHRYPAVGTFHRGGSGPALTLTRPLLRTLSAGLDQCVAVSPAAATTIERAAGLRPDVLFNGFETERFVAFARERSPRVSLLFVGRLEERKGCATLLRAVRAHNETGSDPWSLVVAGDGRERASLESTFASDAITFVGRVSDEEKRRLLRRAHALVAPSTHGESFGMVILEGLASETLVVASDIDGYRDAAGGHATLCAPADVTSLIEAIATALATESPQRIAAGRQHAEQWSMSRLLDRYDEHYANATRHFEANR